MLFISNETKRVIKNLSVFSDNLKNDSMGMIFIRTVTEVNGNGFLQNVNWFFL